MAILVKADTKVLVQGITGSFGGRHTQLSLEYGSQIVAGVTPGKAGQIFEDQVPIFDGVPRPSKKPARTPPRLLFRHPSPPTPSSRRLTPGSNWLSPSLKVFRFAT